MVDPWIFSILADGTEIVVSAKTEARIAIVGREKMKPRPMFWNCASSRQERIELAKEDWRQGRFPKIPGDEDEAIPLP